MSNTLTPSFRRGAKKAYEAIKRWPAWKRAAKVIGLRDSVMPDDPLVRAAEAWMSAPQTQKELQAALERADEATAKLAKARVVDRNTLHEPLTPIRDRE